MDSIADMVLGLLANRCFKGFLAEQAEEDAQNRKSGRRVTLKANQLSTIDGIGAAVGINNQLGPASGACDADGARADQAVPRT
jgi:hypothetical protein